MPKRKYDFALSEGDEKRIRKLIKSGKSPAKTIMRANILLMSSPAKGGKGKTVSEVASALSVSPTTVQAVRKAYAVGGLDSALERKKRATPPVPPKVDGEKEAKIVAVACSEPPEGYSKWTVRMIADRCVELGYFDSISHQTVFRALKKTGFART